MLCLPQGPSAVALTPSLDGSELPQCSTDYPSSSQPHADYIPSSAESTAIYPWFFCLDQFPNNQGEDSVYQNEVEDL